MTPANSAEEPVSVVKKRGKLKKRKSDLSRNTRGARRVREIRKNMSLEKRKEKSLKTIACRKLKLAAEDPEETASRRRREARRRKQYLEQKRQKEKRTRVNAIIDSIESNNVNNSDKDSELTYEENNEMEYIFESVDIAMKFEKCQSDTDNELPQINIPVEVLIEES